MPGTTRSAIRIRAAKRLSVAKVEKTKGPAILEDGEGLRLVIDEKGNRRWVLRLTVNGKRVNRGLGS